MNSLESLPALGLVELGHDDLVAIDGGLPIAIAIAYAAYYSACFIGGVSVGIALAQD